MVRTNRLLIADVPALTGVPVPLLGSWERAGLLSPEQPAHSDCVYGVDNVARVRLINRASVEVPTGMSVNVLDGDTLHVRIGGFTQQLRQVGIGAPKFASSGAPGACFGADAATRASAVPQGRTVWLQRDRATTDERGWKLHDVWVVPSGGGAPFLANRRFVADGFALAVGTPAPLEHTTRLRSAETARRAAHRGLWSAFPGSVPPGWPPSRTPLPTSTPFPRPTTGPRRSQGLGNGCRRAPSAIPSAPERYLSAPQRPPGRTTCQMIETVERMDRFSVGSQMLPGGR